MKKFVLTSLLSLVTLPCWAGTFYIAPSLVYDGITSGDIDYNGLHPQLALGFGDTLATEHFYGAVEGFAYPRSLNLHNNTVDQISLKTKYGGGISLLPGYVFDDTFMLYLRLGVLWTHFNDLDSTKRAWEAGGGLEGHINNNWSARVEYAYARYSAVSGLDRIKADIFLAGLVYRFC